ncbi:MAG: hypothetical protein DSY79_13675 [Chloroflexi bacterium]|nr:MAG: hypothetical protein DSY79_13675 [Chloroflexota bacterium]
MGCISGRWISIWRGKYGPGNVLDELKPSFNAGDVGDHGNDHSRNSVICLESRIKCAGLKIFEQDIQIGIAGLSLT